MAIGELGMPAFTAHDLPDGLEPNLEAQVTYDPPNFSWPFGTHICAVEVDTDTGQVEILTYVAVDDCGEKVNPLIVEGQVHGGVVQGIAAVSISDRIKGLVQPFLLSVTSYSPNLYLATFPMLCTPIFTFNGSELSARS